MVRYVNPHISKIKNLAQRDFERLSQEGAKSLNPINVNTYKLSNNSRTIIFETTKVTNLELVNSTIKHLEFYLGEWLSAPIVIQQPLSYIDCRSILNGKYNDLLYRLNQFNDQAERFSTDTHVALHIRGLTENIHGSLSGKSLSEYITKNVKSIKQLFDKIKWYLEQVESITDRWGNKHKYDLNFVFYANLER